MRKSRVITILCLSLVLCFMCLTTNTFSWFDRAEESGNTLVYRNKTLKQSSGKSFDVATYKQVDGGEYSEPLTNNTISKDAPLTLKAGERQCFKTQIKSNNTSKQNVSLYLSGVKSDDYTNTYVGVNNPMRTYKQVVNPMSYSGHTTSQEVDHKDVYVGIELYDGTQYQPENYYLKWWKSDNSYGYSQVYSGVHVSNYYIDSVKFNLYHAQVPYDTVKVQPYFKSGNNYIDGGSKETDLSSYNIIGIWRGNGNNITGSTQKNEPGTVGAGIKTFYSEVSMVVGNKKNLPATGQGTLKYSSSNPSVATVNEATGEVTAKKVGTTTVTVTSTGTYNDIQQATYTITVNPLVENITPVVTNMEISKYDSETDQNILTVYWYIKNTSSKSINVSVDKINVTL